MTTTWTIAIDWDRDGDYTDTYDDVTDRVMSATWLLGMRQPYQETEDGSQLELVLSNADRRYSPEYSSSPLNGKVRPFKPVRIQSNDGSTTRTHWVGWISSIAPAVGKYGERVVEIVASGPMQFFKAAETHLELQENRRTDEIIADLITEVVIPPAQNRAWILGRVGNSELGSSTYLADTSAYSDLETGKTTLAMAADNWVRQGGPSNKQKDTFNVFEAIRDVVAAERGRFFFDREGKAIFWNRHHLLDEATSDATFDDTMTGMVYAYAGQDQLKNEVVVTCHPRTISASATDILWQLDGAVIRVEPGETRTVQVSFQDEDGNRVGGKEVTIDTLTFSEGSASSSVTAQANGAELTFTNSGSKLAVVSECVLKGRKITDQGQMEAKAIANDSIQDYGRRLLNLNLPSVDNLDDAQSIAQFEVNRRSDPRGDALSIAAASHGVNGGGQHTHQLARTIGDLVTVQETQTDHDAKYYIIGEAHELTDGATLLKTTWYLEPAPTSYPWKLGVVGRSELGTATWVTY